MNGYLSTWDSAEKKASKYTSGDKGVKVTLTAPHYLHNYHNSMERRLKKRRLDINAKRLNARPFLSKPVRWRFVFYDLTYVISERYIAPLLIHSGVFA